MKRNFKKLTAAVLCVAMLGTTALTGCGSSNNGGTAASGSTAGSNTAGEGAVTVKMATGGQDTLPSYASALDVINDLEDTGNFDFNYFGARQLGDDAEILQQVMAGTIQMGGTAASAFSTYTGLLDALAVPFVLDTYEKERTALKSDEVQAIFDAVEEATGVKILVAYDSGMRYLANNKHPIASLADVQGLKLRVVPSDLLIDSFKAIGANPTNLAYGDIYTGLQNGTIDGEEINITSIYSEKHYEQLKYFSDMGIYPFATTIFCNAEWYNSLTAEQQQELVDGFTKGYDYLFDNHLPEAEARGLEAMKNAGMEITEIADSTPFKDAVADVIETYKNKDPLMKAFIEMAEGL